MIVKGFGSGLGSLLLACFIGEQFPQIIYLLCALLLGFVAYGLSIFCYIHAQRALGAAKTSVYYACAPFLAAGLSLLICRQTPSIRFLAAFTVMALGGWLASTDAKSASA